MTTPRRLVLICALATLATACVSSAPDRPAKIITIQSTTPLDLSDFAGSLTIRVREGDTIVTVDDRTFNFRAIEGYIGRLDTHRGWLKIGKIELSYDPEKVWIRGPKTWTTFARPGEQSYVVAQDGSLGRSIFKD